MKRLVAIAALVAGVVARPQPVTAPETSYTAPLLVSRDPAPDAPSSRTRVNVHPYQIRVIEDEDYEVWSITEDTSVSATINSLDLTLSAGSTTLNGNWYKVNYNGIVSQLGERMVAAGVSTNDDAGGGPITLSITGLAEGTHSLLTWHNGWDNLDETATLSVAVDGTEQASGIAQTARIDNIWEAGNSYVTFSVSSTSQAVVITYTPSGADNRVFINGLEIDGPALAHQISFPTPAHRDERVEPADSNSVTATWRAAESATSYNVYLGTSPSELESVALEVTDSEATLSGLNTLDIFYWRVDVVTDGETYIGRVWLLRLAHLAFPGAEGYGRFARGGRGGEVVHVTTLEDNEDPGSLRYALTIATGPRIIVFDVGGVITTTSRISVNDSYVTLAGQTAPGKGIVIQGFPLGLTGAQDIIFRHVRVRPGTVSGETIDGMGMQGSNFAIFDRCSVGWTIDEAFSSREAYNVSLQRSMISEPLNVAGHQNYPEGTEHGYAATVGGDVGSYFKNLIAHAEGRSWSMGGGVDDAANFAGRLDFRNNVVYNFGGRVTDGGAHQVNFVSNYYKPGAASELTYDLQATYEDNMPGTQTYYCDGNSMVGHFDQDSQQYPDGDGTSITENIACYAAVSFDPAPTYQKFYADPFFESYVDTLTSTEAYKRVLSDAGVSQPVIDDHDQRILQETLEGTYTYSGSASGKPGLIDSPADAGGLEDFPTVTRDASWDADGDGIADWWDGSTGGDGYTVIEGYLNFMADPHAFVAPSASVTIDLAPLAAGFVEPSFSLSEPSLGSVSVDGSEATYSAGADAGIDYFDISISDSEGSTWTRTFGVAIFEGAE